jgi:hypothetical protein
MTNKVLLDEWIQDYGEDSDFVRVRVKGEFPRAASNQFIDTDTVYAAVSNKIEGDDPSAERAIGVDVARFGDDQTVICYREGFRVFPHHVWKHRGIDTMETASRVSTLIDQLNPDAVFVDGVGVGGGVVDRLRQMGYKVIDVNAGANATEDERYANKRAEMWGRYRDWLKNADIPDDQELIEDSIGIEYGFDTKNRIMLEKKSDMKKRGLSSPDVAESIVLTFAEKLASQSVKAKRGNRPVSAQSSYNPMKW